MTAEQLQKKLASAEAQIRDQKAILHNMAIGVEQQKQHLQTIDVLIQHIVSDLREPGEIPRVLSALVISEAISRMTLVYR